MAYKSLFGLEPTKSNVTSTTKFRKYQPITTTLSSSSDEAALRQSLASMSLLEPRSKPNQDACDIGMLEKLPLELRFLIYGFALPYNFQQHYDILDTGALQLNWRSSAIPGFLITSKQMNEEATRCLMSDKVCAIVVDGQSLRTNFPLQDFAFGSEPSRIVQDQHAQVPLCRELFIGIQTPSPRHACHFAEVRLSVKRLVTLLTVISRKQKLPKIRVSFETNGYCAGLMYCCSDFAVLAGSLYKLRTSNEVAIDRSMRWKSYTDPQRQRMCRNIETAMTSGCAAAELIYQQLMIDIKLEFCLYKLEQSPKGAQGTGSKRLFHAASELIGWYKTHRDGKGPIWVQKLYESLGHNPIAKSVMDDLCEQALQGMPAGIYREWAQGHMSSVNPYWKEAEIFTA